MRINGGFSSAANVVKEEALNPWLAKASATGGSISIKSGIGVYPSTGSIRLY